MLAGVCTCVATHAYACKRIMKHRINGTLLLDYSHCQNQGQLVASNLHASSHHHHPHNSCDLQLYIVQHVTNVADIMYWLFFLTTASNPHAGVVGIMRLGIIHAELIEELNYKLAQMNFNGDMKTL